MAIRKIKNVKVSIGRNEDDEQFEKFLAQIRTERIKIKSEADGAKNYLIKLGFITREGESTPEYQDLCLQ